MKKSDSNTIFQFIEKSVSKVIDHLWENTPKEETSNRQKELTWKKINASIAKTKRLTVYKKVASVAILIGIASAMGSMLFNTKSTTATVIVNHENSPKYIDLNDGSKVILNRNSSLTYNNSYREVSLKGEAYFTIKKDAKHPFKVHTDSLTVMVYGTQFNVYAYPKNHEVSVALYTGKVNIEEHNGTITNITPGEKYIKNFATQHYAITPFNNTNAVDWTNSKINCSEMKMSELLEKISNYYNVDFIVNRKEIYEKVVSGSFEINNNINHFLNIISFSHDIQYTKINYNTYQLDLKK